MTTTRATSVLFLLCGALAMTAMLVADTTPADLVLLDVPERSDATPSIAAHGRFVAVAWGATADGKADVYVATSRDSGRTFGHPVRVNHVRGEGRLGGELPPRVALHATTGSTVPSVVVLWNARGDATEIKVARSRDGGQTFDAPVPLQAAGAAGDRGWPALAVDDHGTAHAIWLDHRGLAAQRAASSAHGAGASKKGAGHVHGAGTPSDGAAMAQGSALYHAAVRLPGTVEPERTVAAGVCYCCKTALAVGRNGSLVAAWRHVYPGDLRDIALAISPGTGQPFSQPSRVSEDGWAIQGCPDDGPALVVDGGGTTHIVWPTVVGGNEPEGALFYSTTTDGKRFSLRVRIPTLGGQKPTHPQIAIGPSGRLVVAWDESVGGTRIAAMREVHPGTTPRFGEVLRLANDGAPNHPVVAVAEDGVVAAWATGGETSRVAVRRVAVP